MARKQADDAASRREFLKRSMLTVAGALAAPKVAAATGAAAPAAPSIRLPDAIPAALNLPAKPASFPMRGSQERQAPHLLPPPPWAQPGRLPRSASTA